MRLDRMSFSFSEQDSDKWIERNFCSSPAVFQLLWPALGQISSVKGSTTGTDIKSETRHTPGVHYVCLFTFKNKYFAQTATACTRRVRLHSERGDCSTPLCSRGGFLSPCVLLFFTANLQGQDTWNPGGPALCLQACVITSLRSRGPGRELGHLSDDSFKEQRARDSSHKLDSSARIPALKRCAPQVTTSKWKHMSNRLKPQKIIQLWNPVFKCRIKNETTKPCARLWLILQSCIAATFALSVIWQSATAWLWIHAVIRSGGHSW